jgi:hypothetical protein
MIFADMGAGRYAPVTLNHHFAADQMLGADLAPPTSTRPVTRQLLPAQLDPIPPDPYAPTRTSLIQYSPIQPTQNVAPLSPLTSYPKPPRPIPGATPMPIPTTPYPTAPGFPVAQPPVPGVAPSPGLPSPILYVPPGAYVPVPMQPAFAPWDQIKQAGSNTKWIVLGGLGILGVIGLIVVLR